MAMASVMLSEAEKVMFMSGKIPFGHRSTYTGVDHVITPNPCNLIIWSLVELILIKSCQV